MLIVSRKHRTLPHALIARQFHSSARASHLYLPSWRRNQTQHSRHELNQANQSAPEWPPIPGQLSKAPKDLKDPDGNEGNTSRSQPQQSPTKKRRFRIERPTSLWRSRYTKRLDEPIVGLGLDLDFDPFKPPVVEEKPVTPSNDVEDLAQEQLSTTIFETPFLTTEDPTSNHQLHTSKGKLDRPVLMPTSNVVHVSNLPKHFTPTHVRKLMTRFGDVQNVIMERYEREHEMASCSSDDDTTPDIGSSSNPLPTQTTTLYGGWAKVTFRHRLKPGYLRPVDGNVVGDRAAQRAIEACKNDLLVKNESEKKLLVHGQQLSVQPWTENPEQQEKELDLAMDRLLRVSGWDDIDDFVRALAALQFGRQGLLRIRKSDLFNLFLYYETPQQAYDMKKTLDSAFTRSKRRQFAVTLVSKKDWMSASKFQGSLDLTTQSKRSRSACNKLEVGKRSG